MSQAQMQHKTTLVNGATNRRRGDQDVGNGSDNFRKEYQSNRSSRSGSSNQSRMEGVGHQHSSHASSNTSVSQAGSLSKDKTEAFTRGENRGRSQGPWNPHLLHLTACLIGQPVEVQVKCGSIYSGVFHTANAEKDHGIVLKMARLIKDGSLKGKGDLVKDSAIQPYKQYVIYAKDLVQIVAKDVPLRGEMLQNGRVRENRAEILTDSILSQGRHGDLERELKPWVPDTDDHKDLGLDSTFDNRQNRNWDQFETNRTLFGVESTFNEELYTTKLEKGPQMRERHREALRIAREIEGQSAKNIHVAEERGVRLTKDFEFLDEESRFSSVLRPSEDVGEENEDLNIDICNDETFGSCKNHTAAGLAADDGESSTKKVSESQSSKTSRPSSADLKKDPILASVDMHVAAADNLDNMHKEKSPRVIVGDRNKNSIRVGGLPSPRPSALIGDATSLQALDLDPGSPHVTEDVYRDFNEFRQQENAKRGRQQREDQVNELKSFSKTLKELTVVRQPTTAMAGSARKTAAAYAPPASALPLPTSIANPNSTLVGSDAGTAPASQSHLTTSNRGELNRVVTHEASLVSNLPQAEQPSISSISTVNLEMPASPMNSVTSTTVPSSPSSSSEISSSASSTRKSSLNPHAKEFKLNPNAKSFTPNFTPLRPPSPLVQPLYLPGMLPPGTQMQGVPMGLAGNTQIQQAGQSAAKYTPYNNVAVAGVSGGAPFVPSPGTYTPGASGAAITTALGAGQVTMKMPPQLQQPAVGHSYGSQQPVRYGSQAPMVQPGSTYLHPSGHMFSQQMMFGQPGQVLYYQPFPQGIPMPPPQPTSTASQMQTNHREMQLCLAQPYIGGQQHYLPQVQMPQHSNPMQPVPGALAPNTMPTIQPPQGVAGGMMPQTIPSPRGMIPNTSVTRPGGVIGAST